MLIAIILILTGCSQLDILESLRLEEGEIGSICVRGTIDLNPLPLVNSNAVFVYRESNLPDGSIPDC